ncbi:MAG: hypothetical protein JXO22_14380 [Phycisphaerae bacterium]|nr:hypothetical protein [Phycisphaerae bacterium]
MRRTLVGLAICMFVLGCASNGPTEECESTACEPANAQDMRGTLDYMAESALLADMTVGDYHFVPHRAMLTLAGEQRVIRLANLLDAYGGTVRFNTDLEPGQLRDQRMQSIRACLAANGVDTTNEVVTIDLPGSTGMDAREAILIKQNEGSYVPAGSSSMP